MCASLGPVDATFVVAAFSNGQLSGPALFTRATTIPVGTDYAWTNIGAFNVSLNQGQEYIAFLTVADIGAVPEPATWALMIGGFGMAGAMLRRRRMALARI